MKALLMLITVFTASMSHATFGGPVMSCWSSRAYHGLKFEISGSAESGYKGALSREVPGGLGVENLGTEIVKVEPSKENGICRVAVTQMADADGNDFKLKITAAQSGSGNFGKLNMKLNGKKIDNMYSDMSCYIDQMTFNELCKPSLDGGVYQNRPQDVTH